MEGGNVEPGNVKQCLLLSRDTASSTKCVQADNSLEHAGQEAGALKRDAQTRASVGLGLLEFELGSELS
jgi:hypothetical protein